MTNIRVPIWLPLTAILLAALMLRLAAGWYWQSQRPVDRPFVFGDSESYWELARSVAHGEPYQFGTPDAKVFRTPGYPVVLSLVFLLGSEQPSPLAARFISALCGTIAVAGVYGLARSLFDRRAGLIAAAMIAVYPGAIVLSAVVLSEAPFAPLAVLHLGCWALAWKAIRTSAMLAYGTCGGLLAAAATLMRPSWLLFVPFALIVGSLDHRRARHWSIGAAMLCGLAIGMAPWWIRNWQVVGHFVPTTLQVGASLYDGLNPRATGGSEMNFVAEFERSEREVVGATEPLEYRLDQRLRRAAIEWAASHPLAVLELAGIKFARMWNVWPNEPQFRGWGVRLAVLVTYMPLLALGAIGVWRYRGMGFPVALCWLPAVYLALLHVVFVSSMRYREPAMLPMAALAAAVLARAGPSLIDGK